MSSGNRRDFSNFEFSGEAKTQLGDCITTNNIVLSENWTVDPVTKAIRSVEPSQLGIRRSQTADQRGAALLIAAQQGRTDVVQDLLEIGANWQYTEFDEQTALFKAVQAGYLEVVELLLRDKQKRTFFVTRAERQWLDTPLHRAASGGKAEIARALIACHAPIEAIQRDGHTPLLVAAGHGNAAIVEMLLDCGANVHHENNNRGTVLHIASRQGHLDILRLLLDKDSSTSYLERRNLQGDTALFLAVLYRHVDCARLLIERGASVHAANNDQANVLHISVSNGMPFFLEEQLPKFSLSEINAKNRLGHTPLDVAHAQRRHRCINLVRARLAKG